MGDCLNRQRCGSIDRTSINLSICPELYGRKSLIDNILYRSR